MMPMDRFISNQSMINCIWMAY